MLHTLLDPDPVKASLLSPEGSRRNAHIPTSYGTKLALVPQKISEVLICSEPMRATLMEKLNLIIDQ